MSDTAYAQADEPDDMEGEADDGPRMDVERLRANVSAVNLAKDLDASTLARIGSKVVEECAIDEESRKSAGWTERNEAAMKLALQTREVKNHPWPNASNVKYPLISTAAIQFNARAYPALVDGFNVVKGKVLGQDPNGQKQARAERIGNHMSYQLMEEMDGWEEDTDRLLMMLPITGCAFRKTYFDPATGKNCSVMVPPDRFVVNYWTKDLDSCPRSSHLLEFYPGEIETRVRSGTWIRRELGLPQNANQDDQAPHQFIEQNRLEDLDEDGYAEPYVVTVHRDTAQVVRIVARYDEQGIETKGNEVVCIKPVRNFTKYGFIPSPDGSFYDIGFGTLLNPFNETINTALNQLMDAGTLANTQGGFIGEGVSMKSGSARFTPGEFKRVDTGGGLLKDSIVPFSFTGPSTVLFSLLQMLIEAAKDVTATQDIMTGDTQKANQPVGTTLAVIEQGLKTFSAIVKRIHRSFKQELACLYRLNSVYLNDQDYYRYQDKEGVIARQDYAEGDCDVIPVSDPSMATDMQKMGRAQFIQQFRQDPLMNGEEINRRTLAAAGIPDPDKLFAPPPQGLPPELQLQEKVAQQKDRELDQKDEDLRLRNGQSLADIGLKEAQAVAAIAQALTTGAQVPQIAAFIQELVNAVTSKAPDGSVHQGDVRGVGPSPDQPPVPPVPQGQPGPSPVEMGQGGSPGAPPPGQSPPDGGAIGPGVA